LRSWHERIRTELNGEGIGDMLVLDEESPETEVEHPWVSYRCERWVDGKRTTACQNLPAHVIFSMVKDGEGFQLGSVASSP
jgi:hypothetical protein